MDDKYPRDLVGYGHEPNEVVEFFREHQIRTISGNHDRLVCDQSDPEGWNPFVLKKIEWTKSVLTDANLGYLSELPVSLSADNYCLVHGAWTDPDKYLFEERDRIFRKKGVQSPVKSLKPR